ncbi:DUF3606 domain-containing protein [Hydrogenophaga palleronii]|uniref:DUF3606 domain-containing protein n=1 Tax=Hydrogenophaga palleronii TaxID=65655 RepID=UPI000A01155A|nr:DUF3606 domain-containing protein [Hydrogenophaga palleronii]
MSPSSPLGYWAKEFDEPSEKLKKAVHAVGTSARAVETHLRDWVAQESKKSATHSPTIWPNLETSLNLGLKQSSGSRGFSFR